MKGVIGIIVLDCHAADGGGGGGVVPCPPGTNYSYCLRTANDGIGNHIEVGVAETKTDHTCRLVATRPGPPAQIDIAFRAYTSGIAVIELRGPVTNARSQPYAVDGDRAPIIITFTNIDQTLAANVPNIRVTDGAGNLTTCGFSF